jgi:8-oxo-dGTP diphosphatase
MNDVLKSENFPDSFFRVTIKGLCVRDGKVLLLKESKGLGGGWEMPGGGLDFGEDVKEALKREVSEEMGLVVKYMSEKPIYVWTHKYENKRGLDWYYSLVVAYQVDFEDLDFTATSECQEIKFFSKEELESLDVSTQTKHLPTYFNPEDFKTDI